MDIGVFLGSLAVHQSVWSSRGRMSAHAFSFSRFLFRRLFLSLQVSSAPERTALFSAHQLIYLLPISLLSLPFYCFTSQPIYQLTSSGRISQTTFKSSTSVSCFASSSMTHFLLLLSFFLSL